MFDYLIGTLTFSSPHRVTLETQGIGYLLHIPFNNYARLPGLGQPITLFIATVVREDSHRSYGFITREQRDLFESLIDISGIGPKIALALLGHMEISDLHLAISQGKSDQICKIPGIGKKTAERVIIEMRDKVGKFSTTSLTASLGGGGKDGVIADAISALLNLGYPLPRAQKAVQVALNQKDRPDGLSDLITSSLRCI